MRCDILAGTKRIGFLQAERQGLYTRFYGCLETKRLTKLYAVFEGGQWGLGIPVPEGNKLVLRTSVPTTSLPQGKLLCGRIPEELPEWECFQGGEIEGVSYPEGLRKGGTLRFRWSPETAVPAPEVILFYKLVYQDGTTYLELTPEDYGVKL